MIIVDSSLVALWFLPQAGSVVAKRFAERPDCSAPWVLPYEVASALLRARRRQQISETLLDSTMNVVLPQLVQILAEPGLHLNALDIALRHGGAIYDCSYIALARRLGCGLATADAQQARIAVAAGVPAQDILAG